MKYLKKIPTKPTYIEDRLVKYYYIEATKEEISNMNRKISNNTNCGQKMIYKYSKDKKLLDKYSSITQAAKDNNVCASSIRRCANKEYQTAGGYIWRWQLV